MRMKVAIHFLIALALLTACRSGPSGDSPSPGTDPQRRDQRARVTARLGALADHLDAEERASAARVARAPLLSVPPPSSVGPPAAPAAEPTGLVEHRDHQALLGEKQLLADIRIVVANASARGRVGGVSANQVIDQIETQLDRIEGAQRARDVVLGITSHPSP